MPIDSFSIAFLQNFALPLVRGGNLHVGAPLGRLGFQRLWQAVEAGLDQTSVAQEFSRVRSAFIKEMFMNISVPNLSNDMPTIKLLVATHDALFLQHPASSQGAQEKISGHVIRLCQSMNSIHTSPWKPGLPAVLALRHGILHGIFSITRHDIRISYWAGKRDFQGHAPPKRLLAWRRLRRVVQEQWTVQVHSQFADMKSGLGRLVLENLLSTSPLTDFLCLERRFPPLKIEKFANILNDQRICNYVVNKFLESDLLKIAPSLSEAYVRLLSNPEKYLLNRGDLKIILNFFCHLHLCTCLFRSPQGMASEPTIPRHDASLRDFYGLYATLAEGWPDLAGPRDVPPRLAADVISYLKECRRVVGVDHLNELASICTRAIDFANVAPRQTTVG